MYSSRIRERGRCKRDSQRPKRWNDLTCDVLDPPLELKLPVVDVLDPLSQLLGDVVLGAVGPGRAVAYQLLGFVANSERIIIMVISLLSFQIQISKGCTNFSSTISITLLIGACYHTAFILEMSNPLPETAQV